MIKDKEDFFLNDDEAINASKRLHGCLDGPSPAIPVSSNATMKTFHVRHSQLKDAVLCATIREADTRPDELHFGIGDNLIELHSAFKGVDVWVRVRGSTDIDIVEPSLYFNLIDASARRLVAINGIGTVDAQILLLGADDNELRLKLGSARLRLVAAKVCPAITIKSAASVDGNEPSIIDPRELQTALRKILSVAAKSATSKFFQANGGQVYGGSEIGFVVSRHPSFAGLDFKIDGDDCKILAKILGRMQPGRTTFAVHEDHYEFRDELMIIRVCRATAKTLPLAQIFALETELGFVPEMSELMKTCAIAAMARPNQIELKWLDREESSADTLNKIELRAYSTGRTDNCRALLPGLTSVGKAADTTPVVLDARLWFAAVGLFDLDAGLRVATLKNSGNLKLTGVNGETQTTVFLAAGKD